VGGLLLGAPRFLLAAKRYPLKPVTTFSWAELSHCRATNARPPFSFPTLPSVAPKTLPLFGPTRLPFCDDPSISWGTSFFSRTSFRRTPLSTRVPAYRVRSSLDAFFARHLGPLFGPGGFWGIFPPFPRLTTYGHGPASFSSSLAVQTACPLWPPPGGTSRSIKHKRRGVPITFSPLFGLYCAVFFFHRFFFFFNLWYMTFLPP